MEQLRDHVSQSIDPTSRSAGRKAYAAPHLLEYGSAAKLTQANTGSVTDNMSGKQPGAMMSKSRNSGDAPAKRRDR
jgi:hypothetical protein